MITKEVKVEVSYVTGDDGGEGRREGGGDVFGGRFGAEAGGAGGAGEVVEGEKHVIVFLLFLQWRGYRSMSEMAGHAVVHLSILS